MLGRHWELRVLCAVGIGFSSNLITQVLNRGPAGSHKAKENEKAQGRRVVSKLRQA